MRHWVFTESEVRTRDFLIVVPILLLFFLIALKPVPLAGGGTDDFRYLAAAHCLDCLPLDHWARRFPIVWPTGAAISLFGVNSWSLMVAPVSAAIAAVVLLYRLVEHQWGRLSALIAACVLCLTPIFANRSMRVGVDVIELALLLGAVFVIVRGRPAILAGALMSLAVLSRPTQLAAVPMVAALAFYLDRKSLKWFVLGFVGPIVAEASVYFISTRDALYGWKLSLTHANHPSPFLQSHVDHTKSPLFNPDFIGGWQPLEGFHAHWTVQGAINLLASPQIAMTLWAAIGLAVIRWRQLETLQIVLIACAFLYSGAMIYAFAVDPRPRMFMPTIATAAVIVGSIAPRLWRGPWKAAVIALLLFVVVAGMLSPLWRNHMPRTAEEIAVLTQ